MGPRSVERGKHAIRRSIHLRLNASMGPRSVERGKAGFSASSSARRAGFNGAAFC